MTLDQAFENSDFIEALNTQNFVEAFSFLDEAEERSKLFLALQEEGCNPLTGFIEIPHNFLRQFPITKIKIPNSVTSIGDNAFYGCSSLTSVVIPDGVMSIGYAAFYGCSRLTEIVIPDSVTSISTSAFQNCSSLTSVVIGDGVTSVGALAFSYCYGLTSVEIPSSVTHIGGVVFYDCTRLTEIKFKGTKKQAIQLGIGDYSRKMWREGSSIEKIVCTDGVIRL